MQPQHWPGFLRQIHALEQSWNAHRVTYPRDDAVRFLPFPVPQFIAMLADAVMAAPTSWSKDRHDGPGPVRFLDAGCGPGTKIRLAEALFGLAGQGIDIVPAFIAEAQGMGVDAYLIDAFEYAQWDQHDIVFVNKPSRLTDELEKIVCDQMRSDAVLMAANWEHNPGEFGFELVAMEYERPVCGVWRKP